MKKLYYGKRKGDIRNIYRKLFYKYIIKKYLKDCKTILDIGAGTGLFYDAAVKLGKTVDGIDLDDENIRDNIIKKDFKDIDSEYDCCFNSQFIEHVDQFKFMELMQKYCKKILITLTTRPCTSFWDAPDHIRPYTKRAIERLYKSSWFKTLFSMNLYPTKSFIVIGKKLKKV